MRIILASKSPRRTEILKTIGAEFDILPADTDETLPCNLSADAAVTEISKRKADCISKAHPHDFVIAADTVVCANGQIIGKPKNASHAYEILKMLSGSSHFVLTGFTLCLDGKSYSDCVSTRVFFRELSDEEIISYINSGEPMDKAGAYGIQEKASVFVTGIEGDYFNVMGLPICEINRVAKMHFGVSLANFNK